MNYLPALGKAMATIFANAEKSQPDSFSRAIDAAGVA